MTLVISFLGDDNKKSTEVDLAVTRTGFEPVNAALRGRCVKPLHQRAVIEAC